MPTDIKGLQPCLCLQAAGRHGQCAELPNRCRKPFARVKNEVAAHADATPSVEDYKVIFDWLTAPYTGYTMEDAQCDAALAIDNGGFELQLCQSMSYKLVTKQENT